MHIVPVRICNSLAFVALEGNAEYTLLHVDHPQLICSLLWTTRSSPGHETSSHITASEMPAIKHPYMYIVIFVGRRRSVQPAVVHSYRYIAVPSSNNECKTWL